MENGEITMALLTRFRNWVEIAGLLGLGVLAAYSNLVFIFVHSLVNIFAGGRSFTKIYLFLGYLIAILLLENFGVSLKKETSKLAKLILLGLIIGAYTINIGSFIWFAHTYQFGVENFIIIANNGELSSTKLLHNHILKGTAGTLLSFTNLGHQENTDTGVAFVNLLPSWVYLLALALIAVILVGMIYYFLKSWKQHNYPRLYGLIFAIITFSLIKNIVDGGLFTNEAIVSLAFFVYLLFEKSRHAKYWAGGIIAAYIILLAIFLKQGLFSGLSDSSYELYLTLTYTAVLLGLCYLLEGARPLNRLAKLSGVLIILMLYYPISNDLSVISYRNQPIGQDGAIVGLLRDPGNLAYKPIENIGALTLYSFHPNQPTTVGNILDEQKLLDNLEPVAIPWQTCFPQGSYKRYEFILSSPNSFTRTSNASKLLVKSSSLGLSKGLYRYHVTITFPQCWPRDLNIIEQYFLSSGLKTFFISNISVRS